MGSNIFEIKTLNVRSLTTSDLKLCRKKLTTFLEDQPSRVMFAKREILSLINKIFNSGLQKRTGWVQFEKIFPIYLPLDIYVWSVR